uniref:Uncharacterized protein n=1 Tax=Anopheles farauti TaxID=69004 RepID=A0A182QDA1_9DIPT
MGFLVGFVSCCWVVILLSVPERTGAISYRKDTGFVTNGNDQFVFREPATSARDSPPLAEGSFTPMYTTPHVVPSTQVKRSGRVRFADDSDTSASNGIGASSTFFGKGTVISSSSVSGSPFPQRDRDSDQFYTVGASIQFAGSGGTGGAITPPPPTAETHQKPKRKKNKYKYGASEKIYNADGPEPSSGQYAPYTSSFGEPQRYTAPLQGNYLTANGARPLAGQYDNSIANYPELQRPQYPFSMNAPQAQYAVGGYYTGQKQQTAPGAPYNPYQYPAQYAGGYASDNPYTSPYHQPTVPGYYPQAPQSAPLGLGQPPNAQSILGVLQSIFNFAPGTFGTPVPATQRPGTGFYSSAPGGQAGAGFGAGLGGVGGQLRQALDNISENDELQCVPKLVCMMSRSSSGQGFSSYVNRGLLSTILSAVPDSSPWLKFSRAALLGYGIGANSCDAYYPKCPKDEMQILYYLNNHRGGFFRFFSNGEQQHQQQQQQQQYG